jgi:glycosyltransferase involved in cell wall biosynthesis
MKISVIIPAYNAENYIERTLNSIINQSFQAYEIIVIDDGSTDNTYKIVKEKFPSIKLFWQKNQGPSAARNYGIRIAAGDWITFLDADDEYMPDLLENYFKILNQKKDIVWCCAPYIIKTKGYELIISYKGNQLKNNIIDNILLAYTDFNYKIIAELISTCSVIIKKEIFNEIGYFNTNFKLGEDIDLWFRISMKYPKIGYLDNISFVYNRINNNSLTKRSQNSNDLLEIIKRINYSWNYTKDIEIKEKIDQLKYILNIWVWRILKSLIKNRLFNYYIFINSDVIKNLNTKNYFFFILLKIISNFKIGK